MISGYDSFLVDRTMFDQMLANEAQEAGAEVRTGTKATDLSIDPEKGATLSVKTLKERITISKQIW